MNDVIGGESVPGGNGSALRVNLIERSEIDSESEAVSLARTPAAPLVRLLLVAHRFRTPERLQGFQLTHRLGSQ